jgi:hypothetical protein
MMKHFEMLKAALDLVGQELHLSDEDDAPLRMEIGALAMRLKAKIESKKYEGRSNE